MNGTFFTIDDLSFKRFFTWSIILHIVLTAAMLLSVWIQRAGTWGGVGGGGDSSVSVNLVSSAGIPMPRPNIPTESEAVDPTTGLYKNEKPAPDFKPDATKIPEFKKEKPLPPTNKSKVFEKKTPVPENAVPFGKGGGQLNLPSGYATSPGPLNSGGIAASGQGGGDFAGRYPWYIEAVRRAISQNWLQSTIDPSARNRAHAVATFTINRDGSIKNIRITQSSGNSSFDNSAQRALLSIEHFPALPADYSGTYVDVTFDFLPPGTPSR